MLWPLCFTLLVCCSYSFGFKDAFCRRRKTTSIFRQAEYQQTTRFFKNNFCRNNRSFTKKISLNLSSKTVDTVAESSGVEVAIEYLNSPSGQELLKKFVLENEEIKKESQRLNFWTGGNFIVQSARCTGILEEGIRLSVNCEVKGKVEQRDVVVKFPYPVANEVMFKNVLVQMATTVDRLKDTGDIMALPFGQDCKMPLDFRFNDVPHYTWVRAYVYDAATTAVIKAIVDPTIKNKSLLQLQVNIPEVNPAFDTYRIGTILEMIRSMVIALTTGEHPVFYENQPPLSPTNTTATATTIINDDDDDGSSSSRSGDETANTSTTSGSGRKRYKVRICVQQSIGEGIFTGLPLALSSMRPVLESMDWGPQLTPEEKFKKSDNMDPRSEAYIRLGYVGADQVRDDDDVYIIIAPQNVIGASIVGYLEDMITAARAKGKIVILVNPKLEDRPSSNNNMQIRGRAERRAFQDSFQNIYVLRLLYPSSGGYMYPISGMIAKADYHSPYVVYNKESTDDGKELYRAVAAFGAYDPPDKGVLSSVFI